MAQKPGSRSNEDPPQQTAHNVHWARTQRPGSQTRCWLEMLRTVTWRWFSGIRRWRDWTSCSSFSATRRPRSLSLTHRWRCSALQQIPPLVRGRDRSRDLLEASSTTAENAFFHKYLFTAFCYKFRKITNTKWRSCTRQLRNHHVLRLLLICSDSTTASLHETPTS